MKAPERDTLLKTLAARFEKNPARHKGIAWADVAKKLEKNADALEALFAMESSGGEPDVIGFEKKNGQYIFCDCSAESPSGRRSLCYDRAAFDARKEAKPTGSAVEAAEKMGIELLSEEEYRALQKLGEFDLKTSSWVKTPAAIRRHGGALFCDRRYDTVFV